MKYNNNEQYNDYDDDEILYGMSEDDLDGLICEDYSNKKEDDKYEINPFIKRYFANTYMSKKILIMIPRELCYTGDLSNGFVMEKAAQMPIKEAVAYAFYFASLNIKKRKDCQQDYEAARDFIIRVIQNKDIGNEDKEVAKLAFYFFFQGYIEMVTRKFYSYIQHADKREETIEDGISYVWRYIYDKKIMKYDGRVAVTTFFGGYITSWLEEYNAEHNNVSRNQYRQDRIVKAARDELTIELKRDLNLSELVQRTHLNIHQVKESLSRVEYHEKECLLSSLATSDNMSVEDAIKSEQGVCRDPEEQYVQNENLSSLYKIMKNIPIVDQTIFLACFGMEIYNDHIEYIDIDRENQNIVPSKQFNKVAKMFKISAKDVEKIYQRTFRKISDLFEIRRNIKNEYITNKDAILCFNDNEDNNWLSEFLGIENFIPD